MSFLVFAGDNPADKVLAREDVLVKVPDREMARANLDPDALDRISRAAGGGETAAGTYRPLAQASDLAKMFAGRRQVDTPLETTTRSLWDNGWSLAILLVVLGLEWLLRKRARLV